MTPLPKAGALVAAIALTLPLRAADPISAGSSAAATATVAAVSTISQAQPRVEYTDWRNWHIQLLDGPFKARYSRRGLELSSPKGAFTSRIRWRLQPRFANPTEGTPRIPSQFPEVDADKFTLNRARFKVDGEVFKGFMEYNYEQDLVGGKMINLFTDVHFKPWLRIRFGQWKSIFSQERYISSGNQQFVDRSIVNREFTVDRQAGVSINGRVLEGTHADTSYSFEVLTGTGINSGLSLSSPMLVGRYQWNFLGRDPGFSSSDTGIRDTPAAFLAFTTMRNTSAFTRFSSSGGGQLDGFTSGDKNRYHVRQSNLEFMYKYRGFSAQSETHFEHIDDRVLNQQTNLRGGYYQAGYLPQAIWSAMPKGVELAYRYAFVDPNLNVAHDLLQTHTVAVNYFLEGHSNKFTFDVARIKLNTLPGYGETRYRVQYDVHF